MVSNYFGRIYKVVLDDFGFGRFCCFKWLCENSFCYLMDGFKAFTFYGSDTLSLIVLDDFGSRRVSFAVTL